MNSDTQTPSIASQPSTPARCVTAPHYRLEENPDAFLLKANVPGVKQQDIETLVDGDKLIVTARRRWTTPEGWTAVHREIGSSDFRLVLQLDRRVDPSGIKAQLTQGVLALTLPKAEALKPRKIEIVG